MKKLCCVFNIPSLYRETIYLAIDKNYDCEWFFEKENNDIVLFNTNKLNKVYFLEHVHLFGRSYRMKGLTHAILKRKYYDAFLLIGAPMCISIWVLCILLKIFRPKKKIYFWTHGWYGKESFWEKLLKKQFLKLADELFLYGEYAKSLLVKEGFDIQKMHTIHNSLGYSVQLKLRNEMCPSDIYKNHFGNNNPVIVFIGRMTAVKKLDILLDALDLLRQNNNFFNLIFIGTGVEKDNLAKRAEILKLNNQIWFYGPCFDEETNAKLIFNADLCVAPGNIGLTAMHVLMYGCPAITHNDFAYQMPEFEAIKPFKTGCFFERGCAESLKKSIEKWFEINGSCREQIRRYCYSEIDAFWTPSYQMKVLKSVIG